MSAAALVVRPIDSLAAVEPAVWDALRPDDNPFLSHAFLAGLERHGCLRERWGWQPQHIGVYRGDRLVAAAPCYLKHNSHGEFVFDHAWAEAYHRHGQEYYPKLLCAVPYSPVSGPRLLPGAGADADAHRDLLVAALRERAAELGVSGVHVNFALPSDAAALDRDAPREGHGWLRRGDLQFHWHHRGWRDFEDFLGALSARKRKNIRQERRRAAGVDIRIVHGGEASEDDLDAMHAFYAATFLAKGNLPALSRGFLGHLARTMPRQLLMVLAARSGRTIAGALFLRSASTLYGRYWGAEDAVPALHFELCYYQGIEYCLRERLTRFEPGAQGEHKLARGFLPVLTHSRHLLFDPRFQPAVAGWLEEEQRWLQGYRAELARHSPFRGGGRA